MARRINPGGPFLVGPPLSSLPGITGPQGGRGMVLRLLSPSRVQPPLGFEEELPSAVVAVPLDDDALSIGQYRSYPRVPAFFADDDAWVASTPVDDDQRFASAYSAYPRVPAFSADDDAWMASLGVDDDQRYDSKFSGNRQVLPFADLSDELAPTIVVDDDQRFVSAYLAYPPVRPFSADDDAWMDSIPVDDDQAYSSAYRGYARVSPFADLSDELAVALTVSVDDDQRFLSGYFAYLYVRPFSADDDAWMAFANVDESDPPAPPLRQAAKVAAAQQFGEDDLPPQAAVSAMEEDGFVVRGASARWAQRWLPIVEGGDALAVALGVLLEDLRFLAFDYGRPFDVENLRRLFLSGDSARPEAAADAANRFAAADAARNFVGVDPEPQGVRVSFDVKFVPEIVTLTFPFTAELNGATISVGTPVVTVTTVVGADANPSLLLNGAAQISGGLVLQSVTGGLDGCSYHFVCRADLSDGRRLVRTGTLQVKAP